MRNLGGIDAHKPDRLGDGAIAVGSTGIAYMGTVAAVLIAVAEHLDLDRVSIGDVGHNAAFKRAVPMARSILIVVRATRQSTTGQKQKRKDPF